jgi:hypothetical protein
MLYRICPLRKVGFYSRRVNAKAEHSRDPIVGCPIEAFTFTALSAGYGKDFLTRSQYSLSILICLS